MIRYSRLDLGLFGVRVERRFVFQRPPIRKGEIVKSKTTGRLFYVSEVLGSILTLVSVNEHDKTPIRRPAQGFSKLDGKVYPVEITTITELTC